MDTSRIVEYMELGRCDKNWYQECEQTLIEIFGKDQLQIVVKIFSATSINTSLKGNVTLFKRAYYEYLNNQPIGAYLPNIQKQLQRIRDGKDLSGLKINAFAKAMSGDPDAVVVDIWLLRAFKMNRTYFRKQSQSFREGGASKKQFREIEAYIRSEAPKHELQAREMSAMIWSGIRTLQGTDRQTRYTDILKAQYLNSLFPYNQNYEAIEY